PYCPFMCAINSRYTPRNGSTRHQIGVISPIFAHSSQAIGYPARSGSAPVVVRRRDRLEVHGDDVRGGGEGVGIVGITAAQGVAHLGRGLGVAHALSRKRDRELEALLRSVGLQGRQPGVHRRLHLLVRSSWVRPTIAELLQLLLGITPGGLASRCLYPGSAPLSRFCCSCKNSRCRSYWSSTSSMIWSFVSPMMSDPCDAATSR